MKIWKIHTDVNQFAYIDLVDEYGQSLEWRPKDIPHFDRPKVDTSWIKKYRFKFTEKPVANFLSFEPAALSCDSYALQCCKDYLIKEEVEIIPFNVEGLDLYFLNITKSIDCLDEEKSNIKRLKTGRIYQIKHYVFNTNIIEGLMLFKIPQEAMKAVFATEIFYEKIVKYNLTGLILEPIYETGVGSISVRWWEQSKSRQP